MNYSYYAIHWIHYVNNKIKWTDDSLIYTERKPIDLEDLKSFVRTHVIKDSTAELHIENIKEITREQFEKFGGSFLN